MAFAPALAFLLVTSSMLVLGGEGFALPRLQDDAFYYLEIAKNLALHGRSEFAPGVATNGYQPLWLLAVWATGSLFGFTITALKALDLAAVFAGLALFVWLARIRGLLASLAYTFALWYVLEICALNGMETSLLFPGLVLFVATFLSAHPTVERHRAPLLFCATALCLGARLDAALFLLPILAVAPVGRGAKLAVVAALAACGLVYGSFNQLAFGATLPVSGAVKSLGGLQLNHTYLQQLANELDLARVLRMRSAATPYLSGLAVLGLGLLLRRREPVRLRLPLAMLACGWCGLLLWSLRLTFFSSWGVWPWYGFSTLYFVLLGIWIVQIAVPPGRLLHIAHAAAGFGLAVTQLQSVLAERPAGFAGVSRQFIEQHAAVLGGSPVAMGDRAGSFGFDYAGGVYQLEGLVNDADYLQLLRSEHDLRAHLCQAGVPTIVSYEAPLGDYRVHRIDVLRPQLTHHRGPYVTLHRCEELASFQDLTQFNEPNSRIYAWRIDCHVPVENAAGSKTRPRIAASSAAQ